MRAVASLGFQRARDLKFPLSLVHVLYACLLHVTQASPVRGNSIYVSYDDIEQWKIVDDTEKSVGFELFRSLRRVCVRVQLTPVLDHTQ